MTIGKPIVHLKKRTKYDGTKIYFLHCITYFYKTNIIADGHLPISTELDDNQIMTVVLRVREDATLPMLNRVLTPVVHTIELGVLPFADEYSGLIRVVVQQDGRSSDKPNESSVSPADGDEDDRPIGEGR
ncbi:MAG: hypothetical protein AAFP77_18125 [Bacteroidota bacterium]